jgi:hypothetical protein
MHVTLILSLALLAGCDGVFKLVEVSADAPSARDSGGDNLVDGELDSQGAEGLVAWYTMDSVDSGQVSDSAGQHHGRCIGNGCPAAILGAVGTALYFDGADDIVDVLPSSDFGGVSGFTVAAWLYRPSSGGFGCAVTKPFGAQNLNTWALCLSSNVITLFAFTGESKSIPGGALPGDEWHHVAARSDGSTLALLVDGSTQGSMQADLLFDVDKGLVIGNDRDGGSAAAPWFGAIDDVRIYDRPLADHEIAALVAAR